jgi:hypothetical protein
VTDSVLTRRDIAGPYRLDKARVDAIMGDLERLKYRHCRPADERQQRRELA